MERTNSGKRGPARAAVSAAAVILVMGIIAAMALLGALPSRAAASEAGSVSSEAELAAAASSGGAVSVPASFDVTGTIEVSSGTLTIAGSGAQIGLGSTGRIVVDRGAGLVIDGVYLVGSGGRTAPGICVRGSMELASGGVLGFAYEGADPGQGESRGGASAITVLEGGSLVISGGTVLGNSVRTTSGMAMGGAVYAEGAGTSVVITGGQLISNSVDTSAKGVGDLVECGTGDAIGGALAAIDGASVRIAGGTVANNSAGTRTLAAGERPTAFRNEARMGGGIAVWSAKDCEPGSFVMTGGAVDANSVWSSSTESGAYGGGIYCSSNTSALLCGGEICNNHSDVRGGGAFLDCAQQAGGAEVDGALITGNLAYGLGGGIWLCPTGEASLLRGASAAVYGNSARQAGDDLAFSPRGSKSYIVMSDRMLGGGSAIWRVDGGLATQTTATSAARASSTDAAVSFGDRSIATGSLALANWPAQSSIDLANSSATLVVSGNTSWYGGGLASNESMRLGSSAEVTVTAGVTMNGQAPAAGRFTFALTDSSGSVAAWATNDAAGGVRFAPLDFNAPGTYSYVVSEINTGETGVIYDSSAYLVTVTVHMSGWRLIADATYSLNGAPVAAIAFANAEETVNIAVSEVWTDVPADSATVWLYADGQPTGKSLTVTAASGWQGSFDNLRKFAADGHVISYTIAADPLEGYAAEVTGDAAAGFVVTNTRVVDVTARVVWVGDEGASATVRLLADGADAGQAVTLTAETGWLASFGGLAAAAADGHEIAYTVAEDAVEGYDTLVTGDAAAGFTVSNVQQAAPEPEPTPEPEKISVPFTVAWDGDPAQTAVVRLLADGADTGQAVTLRAEEGWSGAFSDLPAAAADGHEIAYTVAEDAIEGYETTVTGDAVAGFVVTNTRVVDVTARVVWVGDEGASATVRLLADGADAGQAVTLTAETGWLASFGGLAAAADDGHEIAYTVAEDAVEGYDTTVSGDAASGFTVSNVQQAAPEPEPTPEPTPVPEPEKISVPFTVAWDGDPAQTAVVRLLADGADTGQAVTLRAEEGWSGAFFDLPAVASDGHEIAYTVAEDAIEGYETTVTGDVASGFTVSNVQLYVTVPVAKVWVGGEGASATVRLFADGADTGQALTLTASDSWWGAFRNLDRRAADGHDIAYTVAEDAIEGYAAEVTGDAAAGFVVTNTRVVDVTARVVWVGDEGASATVRLLADGADTGQAVTLTAETGWLASFGGLAAVAADGHEIAYTVAEDAVEGYDTLVTGDAAAGFTVSNVQQAAPEPEPTSEPTPAPEPTPEPEPSEEQETPLDTTPIDISVEHLWYLPAGYETDAVDVTVRLLADGVEVGSHLFEGISVEEGDQQPADSAASLPGEGAVPEGLEGSSEATPDAAADAGALAGAEIVSADGSSEPAVAGGAVSGEAAGEAPSVAPDETTAAPVNDQTWTFESLPRYATDGHEIVYTVVEDPVDGIGTYVSGDAAAGFKVTDSHALDISVRLAEGTTVTSPLTVVLFQGFDTSLERTDKTLTLSAENGYQDSFENLPRFDETGRQIAYSVGGPEEGPELSAETDGQGGFIVSMPL